MEYHFYPPLQIYYGYLRNYNGITQMNQNGITQMNQQQKLKLVQIYREKISHPTVNSDNGIPLDLNMLGVASPSFRAAYKIDAVAHIFGQDASSEQTTILMEAIEQQIKAFMTDEGTAAAEMLYGQVAILNTTFNKFMPIASISAGKDNFEKYFDTAMKAQEQARKTLQTLYDIKNSKLRTVLIKNAIAQQVNQLAIQTEKIQKQLETQPYVKDDFGSTQEAERLF